MIEQPFRQVHLDFHTSERIAVADRFDADRFGDTLAAARVNSINLFARCHHGWIYYDTTRFPERHHPQLKRNLLPEQVDACRARGIRTTAYITVQWDHYSALHHPEWLMIREDGSPGMTPYEAGFYRYLAVNSPYREFLYALVDEVIAYIPTDGLWFDIVQPQPDCSMWTRAEMIDAGLDPADAAQRAAYGYVVIDRFKREMSAFVRARRPELSLFFNEGHIASTTRPTADAFSHFEIESLPSGHWGYTHFPLTARFVRTLGQPWLGMTGKFHTAWGDFHSFKTQPALEYECFHMLALGGACSIGDQLHPDGDICDTTYRLIGSVYEQVERREPFCKGAVPMTEIGLFTPEEMSRQQTPAAAVGAMQPLQEAGHQFDVIDSYSDFSHYRVIILPDEITLSPDLADKLKDYLAAGGAVIASYRSGLNADETEFALDSWGVELAGDAPFSPDFIIPHGPLGAMLPATEHVMYRRGLEVRASSGTEILAPVTIPYFNREWRHFCSHLHTPSARQQSYPAVTRRANVIYFAHPIFTQIRHNAPRWCKLLFLNALRMLLPAPLIRHDGPGTLIVTLNTQAAERAPDGRASWVLHLLHYIPIRASASIDIIDDVIPLRQVTLYVRADRPVDKVQTAPQNETIAHAVSEGYVTFTVPEVRGHQMIRLLL